MFKQNRVFSIISFVFIATFILLRGAAAQPQNTGFLYPPYFGTTTVNSIFDHEYPVYDDEIKYVGEAITTTLMHNDGVRYQDTANNIPGYSGHDGIDYGLRYQYVLASHAGTVLEAGWDDPANHRLNLGLAVQLETTHNGETYQTDYGHLSALWVSQGEMVDAAGDLLGISGSTGNSTGPHLHFSVHDTADADMNPYGWGGGAIVDPWSQVATGMVSLNLWADRDGNGTNDPPSISNSTVYSSGAVLAPTFTDPRLTPDLAISTTYILDDSDDEFTTIGLWQTETCAAATDCYEDEWHHTVISDVTAVWQPAAGELYAQEYDLYAYIPQGATTTQASYRINHNSTYHWAGIRQNGFFASTNQRWAYLGRYEFTGDGSEYIQLTSKNEGIPGTDDEVTGVNIGRRVEQRHWKLLLRKQRDLTFRAGDAGASPERPSVVAAV